MSSGADKTGWWRRALLAGQRCGEPPRRVGLALGGEGTSAGGNAAARLWCPAGQGALQLSALSRAQLGLLRGP